MSDKQSMRNLYSLFWMVFILGCGGNRQETFSETVQVQRISGNTLHLSDGREVQLLGIENTAVVEQYLQENLTEAATLTYDTRRVPRKGRAQRSLLYAYVADQSGIPVNGALLRNQISEFNKKYVRDSLSAFRSYVRGADKDAVVGVEEPNQIESPIPQPPKRGSRSPEEIVPPATSSSKKRTRQEVVSLLQDASFMVHISSDWGGQGSQGSGFFITTSGIGVSNYHVFEGGNKGLITRCKTGEHYRILDILASSEEKDYVVFRVDISGMSDYRCLEKSQDVPLQGDDIIVYGNPKGLSCTLTRGVVSAIRDDDEHGRKVIQIDASIDSGSSGSPVVNNNGDLIGVATFKHLDCEGCNFAVDINELDYDF